MRAARRKRDETQMKPQDGQEGAGTKDLILVVEDDANDEFLIMRTLKKLRLANAVAIVRDGAEAIDFLFGRGEYAGRDPVTTLRLILLDLKLPKLGGLEVLRIVRAEPRFHELPVVVFTSSAEDPDIAAAYQYGASSYVPKPVDSESFIQAITSVGLYWTITNRTRS
jgi:two-component system, response regulator